MRAVELVRRAGEEVAADRLHVDECVRGVVHGVHERQRTGGAGHVAHLCDVGDRAERVGCGADRDQSRARTDEPRKVVRLVAERRRVQPHRPHREAAILRDGAPGCHVRVMIELGHDDLVTGAPATCKAAREVEGDRRHVVAERHVRRRRVEEVGEDDARLGQHRIRLGARRIRPVRVGIVPIQVVGHRLADGARDLGAARTVEVGDGLSLLAALQRGKVGADHVDRARTGRARLRGGRHVISWPAHCSTSFTAST